MGSRGNHVQTYLKNVILSLLCLTAFIISGCARQQSPIYQHSFTETGQDCPTWRHGEIRHTRRLEDHIIRINPDGLMLHPRTGEILDPHGTGEAFLRHIFCEAEQLSRKRGSDKIRVLFYVHGGLNSFQSTDRKIENGQALDIMIDDEHWHYPVYISWNSGPISTWAEHITRLREGNKTNLGIGYSTAGVIFASDLLTSLGHLPATVYYQGSNEKDRLASAYKSSWLSGAWKNAQTRFAHDDGNHPAEALYYGEHSGLVANLSGYKTNRWRRAGRGLVQTITFPVRYTVGSLWHSTFSSSSWDVMKRRTQTGFAPPSYFDGRWPSGMPGSAVFPWLFSDHTPRSREYEITLVGHSMGTMFLNRALTEYQDEWLRTGVLKNIVYMAAAADIESSLAAIAPVIRLSSSSDHDGQPVNFYNLTLNRVAEVSEVHVAGLIPTGSLLISIDQHHERPEHPLRRTMGSEVNVLSSIAIIDRAFRGAQGNIVFKSFDREDGSSPRQHGDFGRIPFWRPTIWQLDASGYPE
ncbi:hypothetical protein [Isoalcanivorax indicus]|uniref:hypothetical protein n=1 Tax=Isoalcanivorax indicus TaxID=2202653 RepID=UPI0013C4B245|nr:hypothetical protein [Isoalcanivorax indicus]